MASDRLLRPRQVAARLGIGYGMVQSMISRGILPVIRFPGSGNRYVLESEVAAIKESVYSHSTVNYQRRLRFISLRSINGSPCGDFRRLQQESGLTDKELGNLTGLAASTVRCLSQESHWKHIRVETVEKVAAVYGYEVRMALAKQRGGAG